MATRTSSQTGNWNLTSTWGGAAAPGDGDIAIIASGHVVTVTATQTVGDDVGIAITLVGSLIVNAPLTIKSGTNAIAISQQRTSDVTVSRVGANTGSITFNPASGVTPHWDTPNTGSGTPDIIFIGESGDLVPITTSTARGGNRAYFDFTAYPPNLDWDYVSISEMGGTADAVATRWLSYVGVAASSVTWNFVRMVSIGKVDINMNGLSDFTLNLSNCDWRTPRNTSTWCLLQANTATISGTRLLYQNTIWQTGTTLFEPWVRDFKFEGNVSLNTRWISDIADRDNWWTGNTFMMNASSSGIVSIGGSCDSNLLIEENIFGVDQVTADNPHYISLVTNTTISQDTVRLNIVDGFGFSGSDTGDFCISQGTMVCERNLLINFAGVLFPIVSTTVRMTARRNTLCGANASPNAGETNGQAVSITRFTSNLFAFGPHGIHQDTAFVSQSGFNCDYNGFWNMTNSLNVDHPIVPGNPNSYLGEATFAAWWTSGAFGDDNKGLHDVYGDPQFADKDRTMVTWYNSILGSGGSFTNIITEMIKLNGTASDGSATTFNTAFTCQACKDYLRAGFKPTNPIYFNAGDPDDGSPSIGAIDLDPPAAPPQQTFPRRNKFRKLVIGADAA